MMLGGIAAAEAADAEAARKAQDFMRPPASIKLQPPPSTPEHGMMGARDDSEVPAAAELLIEEAQHLLRQNEYDRALVTLQQGTAVAPNDGSVHLMMALARCKAASSELENIQMLTGPEWGDLALRSRRVDMDIDIYREIRAAQGKRASTGNKERFATLLAHARHLAAKTAEEIEQYNSTVDEGLKPFELEAMDELATLVRELRSAEPLEHARAVTRLSGLMLENPRLEAVEAEQAKAKKISDCLKISRMEGGLGLHTIVVTLNSAGEQDQWAASSVICTVLEYDHSTHEAFVSLGGIQSLVVALNSQSTDVQTLSMKSLEHIADSRALGSEYGTVDGIEHVRRGDAMVEIVKLMSSEFHDVAAAAADLARALVSRSEEARDELYAVGAVDALAKRVRYLLPHYGARPVPHGSLPTDWGATPDATIRNLEPGVVHHDIMVRAQEIYLSIAGMYTQRN